MQRIEAFIERYGQPYTREVWRPDARIWLGLRPVVEPAAVPKAIAAMIGYPTTSEPDWFEQNQLYVIDRATAATALAYIATKSLAYDHGPASEEDQNAALEALSDFSSDAAFLTNGPWEAGELKGWNSLTSATFDAGLIAYDAHLALIYWVEDED